MGRKTPIYGSLQTYVEKQCNDPQWVHSKTRKQSKLQHRLHCSWFDCYIVPDIFVKNIILPKNWLLLVISKNILGTIRKNSVLAIKNQI